MSDYNDLRRNMERVAAVFLAEGLPPADVLIENDVVFSWTGALPYVVVYDDRLEANVCAVSDGVQLWSVSVDELIARADDLVPALRAALGDVDGS